MARGNEEIYLASRERRLVALLAIGGPRDRAVLAQNLWPDHTETHALSSLRSSGMLVRRSAPGLLTETRDPLGLTASVSVDLEELTRALEITGESVEVARYLIGVGHLLPGWYDDWVIERRRLLDERVGTRLVQSADALETAGEVDVALEAAQRAAALDPLRESAHRAVVRIHLTRGDRITALRTYQDFRRRSIEEYGLALTPEFDEIVAPLYAERHERASRPAGGARQRQPRNRQST